MSLTVQRLNADSTFLLTFAPPFTPPKSKRKLPGSFTILVDPWLDGSYTVFHPKLAFSQHTVKPILSSLAGLHESLDLIIISQDKADHCHRETLCSLPRSSNVPILATPAAAKLIRDWKHFDNRDTVQVVRSFNPSRPQTLFRIPINAYSSGSADGEVTIAHMSDKFDVAGLHNAIGITYCPPGTPQSAMDGGTVGVADMPMMSPSGRSSVSASRHFSRPSQSSPLRASFSASDGDPALPPPSPLHQHSPPPPQPSAKGSAVSTLTKRVENVEKVISVLYSPHGIAPATVRPYISHHLATLHDALPLTMLFHSMNIEQNPWFMGGIVNSGAPGGIALARELRARNWIGAHDEEKENSGLATTMLKKRCYKIDEVIGWLEMVRLDDGCALHTRVHPLIQGQKLRLQG